MEYKTLLYETVERVTTITVNRPKLNTLSYETLEELKHAFLRAKDDPETKVVLFTGSGERAFIAGMDLKEFKLLSALMGKVVAEKGQALTLLMESIGKPTIAVVNGICLGGGTELALACTMRVASPDAKFGLPEVGLGIMPGYGGTQRLPRLVGEGRAMEIVLSSEPIDAQEAYRIGLVNKIFPKESLMQDSMRFARKFSQKGAISLSSAMQAVHYSLEIPLEQGLKLEASLAGLTWDTEDSREGATAFMEKRKPIFKDK
ncbi:MAG: hypothetical protein APF81_16300 [Desulfosporosinus sp. BRH_c37]|nr:MAG: hypothetical protein APF81_16300 [Desulfosporosinus sp. BRH_c37]